MPAKVLREYQQRGVEIFRTLPEPKRYFFAWDMGAGKTLGAIAVAKTYARNRALVVCPAIVREVWAQALAEHWPGRSVGVIAVGAARKLSKKKEAEREQAAAADVQVVSYDLLGSVRAYDWDMIIVDEFHNLRSQNSVQSKRVRQLFDANPKAWGLGLSGTPIPNEASQLWNPVDTFFPGRWGKRNRIGYVPFAFVHRYCHREENEYGVKYYGLKPERRADLASRFATISQRVVQADFAKYLPPLFVEALPVASKPNAVALAKEWLASLGEEVEHVGIYTHLRETAHEIFTTLSHAHGNIVHSITGVLCPEERSAIIRDATKSPRSIIVGTTHALKEGVSLSFQKAALIVEWVTEVAQVTQFIGRFARQDSTSQMPTRVQFVVGPDDVSRAAVLSERIEAIQFVVKSSRADMAAADVFAERAMSEDEFAAEVERLVVATNKRAGLWSAEEDDGDDD